MYKILSLFVLLTAGALAQSIDITPPNNKYLNGPYIAPNYLMGNPFGNYEEYRMRKSVSVNDVRTDGRVDTTQYVSDSNRTFTLFGKVWPTAYCDRYPVITLGGRDSAKVIVSYRKVGYTGGVAHLGAWTALTAVQLYPGGTGGKTDSIFATLNLDSLTAANGYPTAAFVNNEAGYFQFKYDVTDLSVSASGSKKNKDWTTATKRNQTWAGEAILTFRKKEQ